MVKLGKRMTKYLLAVVPGDARVDLDRLRSLAGGSYVAFASTEKAEALAGTVSGTILPFSFRPELELVVDPELLSCGEIFFNAARLDRWRWIRGIPQAGRATSRSSRRRHHRGSGRHR
jgi:Ala-tRNA(Pro) deacylase